MAWDEARHRLFVANANSDSISVIDTSSQRVASTMPLEPFGLPLKGIAPTALAVAPDGATLFVALGGLNAVAVVARAAMARFAVSSRPAWYPNHLVLNGDGTKLAIATLLGVGSGLQDEPRRRFVHAYRGTVNVVAVPDAAQLDSYTTAVAENNHIATARQQLSTAAQASGDAAAGAAARRRSVAHRARRLHHQGEPHLRSAVRRSAREAMAIRRS